MRFSRADEEGWKVVIDLPRHDGSGRAEVKRDQRRSVSERYKAECMVRVRVRVSRY